MNTKTILMLMIVVSGILMFEFAPGGALWQKPYPGLSPHNITHLIGGGLAAALGLAVIATRKQFGRNGLVVGLASLVLGLVFALDAGFGPLYKPLLQTIPHGMGMQAVGILTILVGLVGILILAKSAKVSG